LGAPTVEQARASVVSYLAHRARPLGVPIHVVVDDPEGQFVLVVNPDGSLGETFTSEPDHATIPPGGHRGEPVDGEPDSPSAPAAPRAGRRGPRRRHAARARQFRAPGPRGGAPGGAARGAAARPLAGPALPGGHCGSPPGPCP